MNYKFCLLAVVCAFLLASCSKIGNSQSDEVVFDDKYKTTSKDEIVIDDKLFGGQETAASKAGSQETTKITADQSRINTMYDGFGNKTETRCFNNHLRLQCVMLRTATNGQKQIFVYGQNGQVKSLPEDMLGKAMTAPADEIANSAGIYQTYRQPSPVQNIQPVNNPPLRPMSSYNSPVQNRQAEPLPTEETSPVANAANVKPPEINDNSSTKPPVKNQ